jgi:intraflagellar transport protein 46
MAPNVAYTKQMPDIESLMQIWPEGMENVLKEIAFPDEKLNISVENYAKLVCNMVDIPIHKLNNNKSVVEALHVLFTLYSEFKENQHFQQDNKANDNIQSMKFY